MHIDIVPNRKSKPAILLRESYREDGKVKKRTVANLSSLSLEQAEQIRSILKGEQLTPANALLVKKQTRQHGNVDAVHTAMRRLKFDALLSKKSCRQRDIIMGVIAALIIDPDSKLGVTRSWGNTTIPTIFSLEKVDEDDVYEAMDWLLLQQDKVEKKLASRHLGENDFVMYDLTSSYFEGTKCPLAKRGYSRDGKKGKLQVNYGMVTDRRGCPVAVSVFEGNMSDPCTVTTQVDKVKNKFGIEQMVLVGDRGMLSQKQIDELQEKGGVDWITAMKSGAIRKLINNESLQLGLFDERNLFSFTDAEYPGERLIACRNTELAARRAYKRNAMLDATETELEKVQSLVSSGKLKGQDKIGVRTGRVINRYKMAKHFILQIQDAQLSFERNAQSISQESALDGIYVVRTSLPEDRMDDDDTVRSYKNLSNVERAFRSLKAIDLMVRPIRHRTENRVRAHIFLCMLAYYVQWHMKETLRPLLFSDEDQNAKTIRDAVAPAKRSDACLEKVHSKKLRDDTDVHSFTTILKLMSTITRDWCISSADNADSSAVFTIDTTPNPKQKKVLELLHQIEM
jgi:transposase